MLKKFKKLLSRKDQGMF